MSTSNKNLEEAKKLNQQSKQGATMSSFSNTTDINSADTQEARELNAQSSGLSSSLSSSISTSASDLQEAKKLNEKSKQNKQ